MSLFAKYGECRSAVVRHRIEIAPSGDRIRNTSWGACVRAPPPPPPPPPWQQC
eukprot:COSAG01_NODE_48332_length_382_cov_0.901060_1_plen_52_part_01